jgi:S1-C subfamily serine protease
VKLGNQDVHNTGDLQQALIETPPGAKVTITYYHANDKKTADLTLTNRPDNVG